MFHRTWPRLREGIDASGADFSCAWSRATVATRGHPAQDAAMRPSTTVLPNEILVALNAALEVHEPASSAETTTTVDRLADGIDDPEQLHQLGLECLARNLSRAAARCFRRAVTLDPRRSKSWNNLGNLLKQEGQLEEARACYDRAIELAPSAAALLNRARLLEGLGRHVDALTDYERGLDLDPHNAKLLAGAGLSYARVGRWNDAHAALERANQLGDAPTLVQAMLVNTLQILGRSVEARRTAEQWLEREPREPRAMRAVGSCWVVEGRHDAGRVYLEKALALDERDPVAWSILARSHYDQGHARAANEAFARSVALQRSAGAMLEWATLLGQLCRYDEARMLCEEVAAEPGPMQHQAESHRLFLECFDPSDARTLFGAHARWGERWQAPPPMPLARSRAGRQTRIGYLSPDFRAHSVSFFIEPILAAHDRDRFELIGFFDGRADRDTPRISAYFDDFVEVLGSSDTELAKRLEEAELDVLVELSGHTGGVRMAMLAAQRFAPLTINYLGYPSTTGNPGIDVRISDAVADDERSLCTERLWRLPHPAWRYRPPSDAPALRPRSPGPPRFGSFNASHKLTDRTIALWSGVLRRCPEASLLLKSNLLADADFVARLRDRFAAHGIAPERVDCRPAQPSFRQHLDVYSEVDVALDTFPYHGTTTTCEALYMGVPVVTLVGEMHLCRVGLSLVSAIGRPEWAVDSAEAFAERAVELVRAPPARAEIRREFESSELMRPASFVAALEARIDDELERIERSRGVRLGR
jgi:protein O-GlcNAc transferase